MRSTLWIIGTLFALTACSDGTTTNSANKTVSEAAGGAKKLGTVTVGDEVLVFTADRQCSVYAGPTVSIWGHLKSDPKFEVVIDVGGPDAIRVGNDGDSATWRSRKESFQADIQGTTVKGTATFERVVNGVVEAKDGAFTVDC